ncbi:hypothetical protein JMUB7520_27150 [Staphylococcus aureus]|nr:hypothetical protein [Staphylococcus aureus]NMV36229.1 hypothetical protein [Staphylococcus aureus]HCU7777524.1 hypothetical protein [Staphylococcus aureus]HDP4215891.1 hypothetical protein [Staphylococcus aureus]HDP4217028.1 hypothetical protein [Staphylococcus aureus]
MRNDLLVNVSFQSLAKNLNLKIKKNIKVDTITPNDHLITFMLGLKERES